MMESDNYKYNRMVADAWCAAFVWKKQETKDLPYPIHEEVFRNIERNPTAIPQWMRDEIHRLARQYRFFHFHLAFPDVFRLQKADESPENPHTGWDGGFDVVLGNPPWEHTELKEKEWFASRRNDIADAPSKAVREKLINSLQNEEPYLYDEFKEAKRAHDAWSHFIRNSNKYPLTGRGRINTYAIFSEANRGLISSNGRVGCIVPSGIATDDTTKYFFQDLMTTRTLASLYDFENRKGIFPGVHRSYKFCLLTLTGRHQPIDKGAEFVFFAHSIIELKEKARCFTFKPDDISLVNPNTHTCPIFRYNRDAELVKKIYNKVPILIKEKKEDGNPWNISFKQGLFNMASDSKLFKTRDQLTFESDSIIDGNIIKVGSEVYFPLYEAKMMQFWDHRAADIIRSDKALFRKSQPSAISETDHKNPLRYAFPIYWVSNNDCENAIKHLNYTYRWFLGFTDITSSTNERTFIPCIIPFSGVGHNMPLIFGQLEPPYLLLLNSNFSSFVFDYIARQKIGGVHATFYIVKQLPVLPPYIYKETASWNPSVTLFDWILKRGLELTYTAWDLEGFARDVGYEGPPFVWDEQRRFLMRCELDAAYFHLYGISADDAAYIMGTFPIVKRKDESAHGTYRTKEKILEIYHQMAESIKSGTPYETQLSPPPADPSAAHPFR